MENEKQEKIGDVIDRALKKMMPKEFDTSKSLKENGMYE